MNPYTRVNRELSVPERHQLKIARDTLKMNDAAVSFMGGPSKEEAREIIFRLTGKRAIENPYTQVRYPERSARLFRYRKTGKWGSKARGNPLDDFTLQHLDRWIEDRIPRVEKQKVRSKILSLLKHDPSLLDKNRSWPELREMSERGNPFDPAEAQSWLETAATWYQAARDSKNRGRDKEASYWLGKALSAYNVIEQFTPKGTQAHDFALKKERELQPLSVSWTESIRDNPLSPKESQHLLALAGRNFQRSRGKGGERLGAYFLGQGIGYASSVVLHGKNKKDRARAKKFFGITNPNPAQGHGNLLRWYNGRWVWDKPTTKKKLKEGGYVHRVSTDTWDRAKDYAQKMIEKEPYLGHVIHEDPNGYVVVYSKDMSAAPYAERIGKSVMRISNPAQGNRVLIGESALRMDYIGKGKAARIGYRKPATPWRHDFTKTGAKVYGLANGDVLLHSNKNRLWFMQKIKR